MEVSNKSYIKSYEEYQSQARAPKSELGKDAFLKILVMQLSNQNPLEPTSDTEFISQLAQISMLEQIQSLNSTMTTGQNQSLVGKYVYVTNEVEGKDKPELVFGKVSGILKQDGIDYILIGKEKFEASKVVGVMDSMPEDGNSNVLQSSNLIGKAIRAKIKDEDGNVSTITGVVEKITISEGTIYALVNGKKVAVADIEEIATDVNGLTPVNPSSDENSKE
jgi:flagellar basal-body rod modification protein FlgD